jgi:hypothetical protein
VFSLPSAGSGPVLTVNGCISVDGSVVIQLTEEDLKALDKYSGRSRQSDLISANCVSGNGFNSLSISFPKDCRKVTASRVEGTSQSSLSVVFKLDRSRCDRWWIILVSVLGGVIIIVVIVALLAAFTPLKAIVRPFSRRKATTASP